MHKFLLSSIYLLLPIVALGRQLSAEAALSRAIDYTRVCMPSMALRAAGSADLAHVSSAGGINDYYVFNVNDGFVIVSADDCAAPVLGYSLGSSFDIDSIPDNLRWWLTQYQAEISYAIDRHLPYVRVKAPERAEVEPMVSTRWNQGKPYNDLCPDINGTRCVTGCGATAMAQVMHYHKWPARGVGHKEYSWSMGTIYLDFADMTFDWDSMLAEYNSDSPAKSCAAVAQLMYACGVASEMDYSTTASSTSTSALPQALISHFDYDKGLHLVKRNFYSSSQWQDIIYNELAASRPVMYGGTTADKEGHEFVCDGYKDGYFHINWGWSGISDGYFLLSALSPDSQGIGGADSGFNFDQDAIIGIQRPLPDSQYALYIGILGNFETYQSTYSRSDKVMFTSPKSAFFNLGISDVKVYYGVRLVDSSGSVYHYATKDLYTLPSNKGYNVYQVDMSTVPDGDYTVYPAVRTTDGVWHDMLVYNGYVKQLSLKATSDYLSFTPVYDTPDINVENLSLDTPIYNKKYFKVTATLNAKSECTTQVNVALYDIGSDTPRMIGEAMYVTVYPDLEYNLNYISKFTKYASDAGMPQPGNYELRLVDISLKPLSGPISVYYKGDAGPTSINMQDFCIVTGNSAPMDDIHVKGTLKCTKGFFANNFVVYIFPGDGGYNVAQSASQYYFLSEGESVNYDMHIKFMEGEVGQTYLICPYLGTSPLYSNIRFTLAEATPDGITDTDIDTMIIVAGDKNISVCALPEGQLITITDVYGNIVYHGQAHTVAVPSSGLYIVTAADKHTKVMIR